MSSWEVLRRRVVRFFNSTAPGLFNILELLCIRSCGMCCIELLLEDPQRLVEVLVQHYGNASVARLIAALYIEAVLPEQDSGLVRELTILLTENPKQLKNRLKQILDQTANRT